jgi:hypothetical protein
VKINKKIFFCLYFMMMFVFLPAASAWAAIAANTQIINNASLTYNDGSAIRTVNATPVIVTVSLVPGTPSGTGVNPPPVPYTGTDTQISNTFTIVAGGNGPDNYTLTPAITGQTNGSGATAIVSTPSSPVTLGATITIAGSTASVISVPFDGTADSKINEIALDDVVVINNDGIGRTVTNVVDSASGSSITVSPALSAPPPAGVLVAEQKTVTVTVKSGTIATAGSNIVITKTLEVASVTDTTKKATIGPITDTYTSGVAALTKYVRNVTTASGSGTSYSYNSGTYYLAGVTTKPGEVLEYLLIAANSGTGSVSSAVITDVLPTGYVVFKTGVYSGSTDVTYVDDSGVASYLTANGSGAANYSASTLTVNVGTGATSSAGGIIPANKSVLVLYRVTVNN